MRWILIALMGAHGVIHVMGFAKGFGYADPAQLTQPISRAWGLAWLAVGARSYWIAGACALLVSRVESDGTFTPRRFSTPVRDYRDFGPMRLMSFGEARWQLPDGEFTYGEFHLVDITYNAR